MGASTIPAGGASGGLQPRYQKFTSSGTFTLPDGYGAAKPLLVNVLVIGGGGAGGPMTGVNAGTFAYHKSDGYFGDTTQRNLATNTVDLSSTDGAAGGSGGIASTQFYLTANLTITVGAAGTISAGYGTGTTVTPSNVGYVYNASGNGGYAEWQLTSSTGNSGGITTAGSVSASGGTGGFSRIYGAQGGMNQTNYNTTPAYNQNQGSGGTPSGTTGKATPLLGTLAGGSGTTTPVYGSFGIGGKRGDNGTSTGVEGTGAGFGSIGASGAVILTWWQ